MAFLLFFGVATLLPEASFVGSFGSILGHWNQTWFGYISYIYPFLLILPALFFYRDSNFNARKIEIILSMTLLMFSFLMFQAVVVKSPLQGYLGFSIVEILQSFIGILGVWLFIIAIASLSFSIILNTTADDMLSFVNHKLPKKGNKSDFEDEVKEETEDDNKYVNSYEEEKEIVEKEITQDDINPEDYADSVKLVKKENVISEDVEVKIENKEEHHHVEIISEVEENKKLLDEIEKGEHAAPKDYRLPPLKMLTSPPKKSKNINESEIDRKISDLLEKLKRFKIDGDVVRTYSGPVVTTFEFKPAPHVKVSKILTLQDDLAMALKAKTIRIQAPVPGKDVVGIEVPNAKIETIYLKEVLESDIFIKASSPLTIALGKDIVGNPFITDLKKLPHLLIAGTTGSGKSVGINSMLLSLLYRNSPDTLKLLMIDPKMLEFSIYNDIPHLLTPVITKPKQAIIALANMVSEMERRYQIMSQSKTKNIENYNEKAKKLGLDPFPYIVVIIDELADLMMNSGKEVEFYIARLAQMARASGIHLIVATQRPSVDVVTGLIKANLPSRISYKVGSKIDSKVILDATGADSLLGRGDMLFTPPSSSGLIRLHAPFASEDEIEEIVEYLKKQRPVSYDESFLKQSDSDVSTSSDSTMSGDIDELFEEAKAIVQNEKKCSISYIQRRLQIGYNRASRIVEQLETMGILSAQNSKGQREII
ncbi:FtsK/SpoIIIE family DNA translocase [Sulfurospirillum arcachonense]|uniref:FtsK/SpoIIIE family DNA translocase n=1 Tax=Sulfurospirillum arcachonense TaxID=57666 RepID=UPI000559CD49